MFVGSEGGKLLRRIDKLKCEFFREIKIQKKLLRSWKTVCSSEIVLKSSTDSFFTFSRLSSTKSLSTSIQSYILDSLLRSSSTVRSTPSSKSSSSVSRLTSTKSLSTSIQSCILDSMLRRQVPLQFNQLPLRSHLPQCQQELVQKRHQGCHSQYQCSLLY